MKSFDILDDVEFNDDHPAAKSILIDKDSRLIRFCLLPGQIIKEHSSPSSPVYIIILEGKGLFSNEEGILEKFGENTCIKYDQNEKHSIQAIDEKLIFIALLRGSPRKEN